MLPDITDRLSTQLHILFLYLDVPILFPFLLPVLLPHLIFPVTFSLLNFAFFPLFSRQASDSELHSDPIRVWFHLYIHNKPPHRSLPHYLYRKSVTDSRISFLVFHMLLSLLHEEHCLTPRLLQWQIYLHYILLLHALHYQPVHR